MKSNHHWLKKLSQSLSKHRFKWLRRSRKFAVGVAVTTFLAISLVSCIQETLKPLRVGFSVWPGYESLYLARDLNYYKNTSIRLIDYPSNSEIIRAFRNGDLEAATLTLYEALLVAETNPDIRIVLMMDNSNGADVVLAKPEIKTLQELKGHRVGVESGGVGAYVLTRALEKAALMAKDIQVVSLGVSEHEQAFKQGTVDAVVTYEPTRSKLLEAGATKLFDSTEIPGEVSDVLAVRGDVLNRDSSALEALIAGHFRALHHLEQNVQDAAQRIASREGVTPEEFLKSLKGIYIPSLKENQKILGSLDTVSNERMRRVAKLTAQAKLLSREVDPTILFDDRLVKDLQVAEIQK